jgi:hypothetical protein
MFQPVTEIEFVFWAGLAVLSPCFYPLPVGGP